MRSSLKSRREHYNSITSITHRELHPENCSLSLLVLGLCPTHSHHIGAKLNIRKQKENYLAHWKNSPRNLVGKFVPKQRIHSCRIPDPRDRRKAINPSSGTDSVNTARPWRGDAPDRPGSREKTHCANTAHKTNWKRSCTS